jgi:DNA-binding MarR family transcriptional regulator
MTPTVELDLLIRAVRRAFQALKAAGDALHADLGVSAAMRAVMEHLAEAGPASVPHIARAKGVTRQHIQVLADELVAAGLARFRPNAAHKRSDLLVLAPRGEKAFARMRAREAALLAAIAQGFAKDDLRTATQVVRGLADRLDKKGATR